MAELTQEELSRLKGSFVIKCVKVGGLTLSAYGQKAWTEGEELDLLDDGVPDSLRAADYWTAENMCTDPSLEIAQAVLAGDFEIVLRRRPDPTVLTTGR